MCDEAALVPQFQVFPLFSDCVCALCCLGLLNGGVHLAFAWYVSLWLVLILVFRDHGGL